MGTSTGAIPDAAARAMETSKYKWWIDLDRAHLPTAESGTADTWNAEEAQVAVDDDDNVHAMWMGSDNMPYYAYSLDEGNTWSDAMMIAPPTDLVGTGFPS